MGDRLAAIVLAAGEGKRMKSGLPKVLHKAAGRPLLAYVLDAVHPIGAAPVVVVTSVRKEEIAAAMGHFGYEEEIAYAVQDPPRGTADAARIGMSALGGHEGPVLVAPGDTPLLTTATLAALVKAFAARRAAATLLTAIVDDPTGYGRVLRDSSGAVLRVVEDRDASAAVRKVNEINTSVYVFDAEKLAGALDKVNDLNDQAEFYLTDVIQLLQSAGETVTAHVTDATEVAGVNSRAQLADAATALRDRVNHRLMDEGVTIVDPSSTFIDATVTIGRDAVIHPFSFIEGTTTIGPEAEVGPQVRIVDSQIEEAARVSWAVVLESSIGPEAHVGPFASVRPGTRLERGAKLGTFVEAKKSTLGEDSKANHLAYLGDATLGRGVNVGAGTITCNWDGQEKHATVIEDDAYIGSDTMLVAPVRIGRRAATGAGAVVNKDVPDDALAVGVPARVLEERGDKMARGSTRDAEKKGQ